MMGPGADDIVPLEPECEGDLAIDVLEDAELRRVFLETSEEASEQLGAALLDLETRSSRDALPRENVDEVFRLAHNLKSAFASARVHDAAELTHRMESVLEQLRSGRIELTDELMNELLRAADRVHDVVEALRERSYDPWPEQRVQAHFAAALAPSSQTQAASRPLIAAADREDPLGAETGFLLRLRFAADEKDADLQALMLLNKCKAAGEVLHCDPDLEQHMLAPGEPMTIAIHCKDAEAGQRARIEETLAMFRLAEAEVEWIGPDPDPPGPREAVPASEPAHTPETERILPASQSTTLRVDVERLDALAQLGRELGAEVARLEGVATALHAELGDFASAPDGQAGAPRALQDLEGTAGTLDRLTKALTRQLQVTRRQPIGPVFGRFRRVVRDLAQSLGKDVWLEIEGEQTELDKRLLDELVDPLTHLVRNAIDHGIETPAERRAAGKPERARLVLAASLQEGEILVEVRDDGRGIDAARVRERLVERGVLSAAAAAALHDTALFAQLFAPGFSTAREVSAVSGRGIGLDVVQTRIAAWNGRIEIDARPGSGCRFVLRLPRTLGVVPAVLVEIRGEAWALPAACEIVSESPDAFLRVRGRRYLRWHDRLHGVWALHEFFADAPPAPQSEPGGAPTLLALDAAGACMLLEVDRVLGREELVIEPIDACVPMPCGIAGAALLGDGRVVLVLDPLPWIKNGPEAVERQEGAVRRGG